MSLSVGTHIGAYVVTAHIGAGGMGEVYRAHDTRLGRDVALKVLPGDFARDPDRLARFRREAQLLASLNHPHIAAIHGFEETGEVHALILELVEGETLADRIARGALPLDEAVAIGQQIAEALEAAHEQGIVHRDLKPANVKLRPDGAVKVLDFGLAKALTAESVSTPVGDLARSPTLSNLATRAGIILGTAAYMSPEQARGKPVDRRADIWAFGCVLYEMLTGTQAFPGSDFADTLGAITHVEPDWKALPADVPPVLHAFVRRCLHKSQAQRVRDAGDVRLALEGAFDTAATDRRPPGPTRLVAYAIGGAIVAATAAGGVVWNLTRTASRPTSRFSHVLPADQTFTNTVRPLVAISPDGTSIVYVANNRLYRREITELDGVPIRGTDGSPSGPFFSPDGLSVGYWDSADQLLRIVAVSGGTPVGLTPAKSFYGGSWGADDDIIYGQEDGIWRVPADGAGQPHHVVRIENSERIHGPRLLPDGRTVLFTLVTLGSMVGTSTAWDTAQVIAQSLDSGERTVVVRGSDAQYIPTGHLVYAIDRTLFAVPFDAARKSITGRPVAVVEGVERAVRTPGSSGSANYDFSTTGTLVYVAVANRANDIRRRLVGVDMKGNATPLLDDEKNYWRPRISPDGRRLAVEVAQPDANGTQIWIVDLERKTASPLTQGGEDVFPAWTPDGHSVIFRSNRGAVGIYRQAADGSGEAELLFKSAVEIVTTDISHEGILSFTAGPQTGERSIRTLRLEDKSDADFLDTPAWEHMPAFSPDGRWMAYASNESVEQEVYVRSYPKTSDIGRRVSISGGLGPVWARDGKTLYYRSTAGEMMAVPVTSGQRFTAGRPQPLFRFDRVFRVSGNSAAFDIHPDGTRFIMVTEPETPLASPRQLHIVQNWLEELNRLAPTP